MKLKNTTGWPDYFVRRVASWCCKSLGLPVRKLRKASFGKRSRGCFNGRAWPYSGEIRVVIGPASCYPVKGFLYPGRTSEAFRSPDYADQLEGLVGVTAHEIQHLVDRHDRRSDSSSERRTRKAERDVLESFRSQRDALVAEWSAEPKRLEKPKPTRQEQNESKARKKLAEWERKMKLAKTKVSSYRRKVRYYDRVAANKSK